MPVAHQFGRHAIDRHIISGTPGAAARNFRFEIAGGEGRTIADPRAFEEGGEEAHAIVRRPAQRGIARRAPVFLTGQPALVGAAQQTRAAFEKRRQRGSGIALPQREIADMRAAADPGKGRALHAAIAGPLDRRRGRWRRVGLVRHNPDAGGKRRKHEHCGDSPDAHRALPLFAIGPETGVSPRRFRPASSPGRWNRHCA